MFVFYFVLVAFRIATALTGELDVTPGETASKLEKLITAGLARRASTTCEALFGQMTAYNGILLYYVLDTLPVYGETIIIHAYMKRAPAFLNYSIEDSPNELGCFHWIPTVLNQTKELWKRASERHTQ